MTEDELIAEVRSLRAKNKRLTASHRRLMMQVTRLCPDCEELVDDPRTALCYACRPADERDALVAQVTRQFSDRFEAALAEAQPFPALKAVAQDVLDAGFGTDQVVARLTAFSLSLRAVGREEDEDIVLEVLDCLSGWTRKNKEG